MSETAPPGRGDAPATWHLSAELCRRFLEQRVSAPERRAVMRHLITQCPECLGLFGRISAEGGYWFGKQAAGKYAEGDYAQAFQTALKFASSAARRMAFDRLRGWAHWSALDPLLPDERFSAIVTHREWHHWGLFRALLDAAHWYSQRDPHEAADIAQLALDIVDLLSPLGVGGEAKARDMRARAWAVLADCRRLTADLDGARTAIAEAWKWSEEGAGDPLDRARIFVSDASYAAMIGESETAYAILEKALSLCRAADDRHLEGRTLVQMATTIGYVNPEHRSP